jgi:Amt family ammonium transporter
MGGLAERGRVLPAMVFTFMWTTFVYCPLAYWAWSPGGWAFKLGVLDFAGGGPVEIGSGVGGLAFSWVLGRRHPKELHNSRPYSVSFVTLGTLILWFGWLGFNGSSAYGANMRAVVAVWNTMLSGAFGGITWCLLDFRLDHKWGMVGFCTGTIVGLIAATPASGFIPPWAAVIMGIASGALCNVATKIKFRLKIDDAVDIFAAHGIGGIIGLLFNAFFSDRDIIALDGVSTSNDNSFIKRLVIQSAYICATFGYTFVVTALIAALINLVPGLRLRATPAEEILGMDDVEIGEFASDYVEARRDWNETQSEKRGSQLLRASDLHADSVFNTAKFPEEKGEKGAISEGNLRNIIHYEGGKTWEIPSLMLPQSSAKFELRSQSK